MEMDTLMFNNIHHSLKVIGSYYSYKEVAFDEKSSTRQEKELNDLKYYYSRSTDPSTNTEVLDSHTVDKMSDVKHSDNIYDDVYAKHLAYLLKKLSCRENYSNFDIINDKDFMSVIDSILGLKNLQNKDLLKTLEQDEHFLLKNIISSLLTEIRYYIDYLYKQQVLCDHSSNLNVDNLELWFPIAKYTNVLINSNYKDITKDVFLNPDFLRVKEKQMKLFLDGFGYMVSLNGKYKLPYLMYSSSCDCKENSIINIGGLTVFSEYLDEDLMRDIYINFEGFDLPPYFDKKVLTNPNHISNNYLYIVNTVTNTVTRLRGTGDVPLNLLKPTITKLNSKYVFINGGIQIRRHLVPNHNQNKSNKLFIKQEVHYNKNSYILNTDTGHYTLIKDQDTANNISPPTRAGHSQVLLKDRSLVQFEKGYLNYLQKLNSLNNSNTSAMDDQKLSIQNFLDDSYDEELSTDSSRQGSDSSVIFEEDEIDSEDSNEQKKLVRWNILLFGGFDSDLQNIHNNGIGPTNDMYLVRIYLYKEQKPDANIIKTAPSPTMFVKKIVMDEKLTGTVPDPTAFHSSTLIPPCVLKKDVNNPFYEAGQKLDQLVDTFEKNEDKFDIYLKALRNQDVKSNKMLLNDIKVNVLENNHKNFDGDQASHTLLIHGGYKEEGGFHDKFHFFNFIKFRWEERKLLAPLSADPNMDKNKNPLKKPRSKYADIHLRLANHHFFLKGKYIICVGGNLDTTKRKDYISLVSKKIPVTVIHLPSMEIKDVTAVMPQKEPVKPKNYTIGFDGDVIQCSNGELYLCNGVGHILYDKDDVKNRTQVILSDKNLTESQFFYDQIGLLGLNMVYIPPTFTNL